MTNGIDHSIGTDEVSLANDARLELAFTQFYDGLIDEAQQNERRLAVDDLSRANQEYLRAGHRRLYRYFTGVPLEQADTLKRRLATAAETGHETVEQIRRDLRATYENGFTGGRG